jgi:nucleotide-binding universal stress UspA family protein
MMPLDFTEAHMANLSNKIRNSFEGALAGGGDPATSPLYVFGPFLKLILVAGVASVTFGASIWLVVLTIFVVSAMYRLVMKWVVDGSGGSGLSEEEFGGWAVKVNAAITFIEYTLTFLVSTAAMVTFLADRLPFLNDHPFGLAFIQYRTIVAILLSLLIGWLVNRGPKMAARTFGPATGGVLLLLWVMVFATIIKNGLHFPSLNLLAFTPGYLQFTVGGYVRILAVMTGIEVFANLVAAYGGEPAQKSKKAFESLLIIMGTTAVTMLVVGPVIYSVSDPINVKVSVFTQAMDYLLPAPLPYLGTLVGIAVLMSASAASAQGLQNLALGLRERRYIPPRLGQPNRYEVADMPVWIEVGIVCLCFLLFGTHEETYLALYAAGVFILLSMTGWAVTKRLIRQNRKKFKLSQAGLIGGTIIAAMLTTSATIIIFTERFLEGAWAYFILIPVLYAIFSRFRKRYGEPTPEMDYLGQLDAAQLAGFGFGQVAKDAILPAEPLTSHVKVGWRPDPKENGHWREERVIIRNLVVLLDGSDNAAQALPLAMMLAQAMDARLTLLSAIKNNTKSLKQQYKANCRQQQEYLNTVADELTLEGLRVQSLIRPGSIVDATRALINESGVDLVVTTTRGGSNTTHWLDGGVARKLVHVIDTPVLLIPVDESGRGALPKLDCILVALDGSNFSERILPFARALAKSFGSKLILLCVPAVPEMKDYRAAADIIEKIRRDAEANMRKFLEAVGRALRKEDLDVHILVAGTIPAHTIVEVAMAENADMIMLTSQGRGGYNEMLLGSVAENVVQDSQQPVFMVPIQGNPKT